MGEKTIEITSEIYQIGGSGMTDDCDAAIYLVRIGGDAALIDSGCGRSIDQLLENMQSVGVETTRLRMLFLTHCHYDHTGGAAKLQSQLAVRVVMHALDAPYVENADPGVTASAWYGADLEPFCPDLVLMGPFTELDIGGRAIQAIHVPGHSPGSLVYLLESCGRRVLFGQDVHGPLHPSLKSDAAAYQHSLKNLLTLEADILCEGHFGIIEGQKRVRQFIQGYII